MKIFVALFAVIAVVAAQKYTTKYDGIDIEEILKSDRLFNNYFKCLMDQGRCTPDGTELKTILPDALKTNCAKCSDRQRDGSERVFRFLINNKKEQWAALQGKYDPEGIYLKKYKEQALEKGIEI